MQDPGRPEYPPESTEKVLKGRLHDSRPGHPDHSHPGCESATNPSIRPTLFRLLLLLSSFLEQCLQTCRKVHRRPRRVLPKSTDTRPLHSRMVSFPRGLRSFDETT